MKTSLLIPGLSGLFLCCFISCSKNNNSSGATLSNEEKKLLGWWNLEKQIIEEPGQPIIVLDDFQSTCFMEFKDEAAPLLDDNSPIFSNTKSVEDNKDCTWLVNAWKIDNNGKLLLASLDTLYADILFISTDSLSIKVPSHNNHSIIITYGLTK